MKEEWKPVVGHEGSYEVSNLGRVKSFRVDPDGRIIRGRNNTRGYRAHTMQPMAKEYQLHTMVVEAFRGPRPRHFGYNDGVKFIDGDKQNCKLENLVWATHKEVGENVSSLGAMPRGDDHFRAKLNETQVRIIRRLLDTDMMIKDIAKLFGVIPATVSCIKGGQSWSWLPQPIKFIKVIP